MKFSASLQFKGREQGAENEIKEQYQKYLELVF